MDLITILEWLGCSLTIAGAYLIASYSRLARFGWLAWLLANAVWAAFAILTERNGLLVQQVVLSISSLLGAWRAGLFRVRVSSIAEGSQKTHAQR